MWITTVYSFSDCGSRIPVTHTYIQSIELTGHSFFSVNISLCFFVFVFVYFFSFFVLFFIFCTVIIDNFIFK